jgi:aspartyl-tRNA(Asn)/glutamyl-tRNA(Gln) amidotransferase subunit A
MSARRARSKLGAASYEGSDELAYLTIREAARLLRARKVSSVELTRAALLRAERLDPQLHAFITLTPEMAMEQALAADRALRRPSRVGDRLGLLHGIPVTIKDNYRTKDVRTTAGSRILAEFVPSNDAKAVARLREAGAVFLGKTNMNEFAYGIHGLNPHYGDVRNPWNVERTTGGSSSGSAACVAAGIGFASVGTDTGGSLRIPASFCGIVGFKPTHGRVNVSGIVPLARTLDHAGPLTRTVDDAEIIFGVMRDDKPRAARTATRRGTLGKLRIGWPKNYFFARLDAEVETAIAATVKQMEALEARTVEVQIPCVEEWVAPSTTLALADASGYHVGEGYFPARAAEYSDDVRKRLEMGMGVAAADYLVARDRARWSAIVVLETVFEDEELDVIVAPATPMVAPRVGELGVKVGGETVALRTAVVDANRPANFTGSPAIALPCGFSGDGMPIGLQLIGRRGGDDELLAVAREFERAMDWQRRRPSF